MPYALSRPLRALAAAALVLGTATAGAGTASAAPAPTGDVSVLAAVPKGKLRTALLTVKDLPKGFAVSRAGSATEIGSEVLEAATPNACAKTYEAAGRKFRPPTSAEATFVRRDGATVVNGLSGYASVARAKQAMASARAVFTKCSTLTYTLADGTVMTMKYAKLALPKVGDEVFALRQTTTIKVEGRTLRATGSVLDIRRGKTVSSIVVTSFSGAAPGPRPLAKASAARLAKLPLR
ncbi:hypothetical protein [Motilibacter aurantiacus]|uniref:hypothetical protein n=1 Tax=Motilibacter aurantiacus TaxID=2714955 RepID=UPI00140CE726|nr:hypothetical protein [Motilibacter aurantiacus]NHC47561.1 hypothetical protein [Motilibacter aurantiacus]